MRELTAPDEVADACGDEVLVAWAARGLAPNSRVWEHAGAIAAASPNLSRLHRVAVAGPADGAEVLLRHVLEAVGPTVRPVGAAPLIEELGRRFPELTVSGEFGWMQTADERALPPPTETARWLDRAERPQVAVLLKHSFPDSYAHPDDPHVRRWAGAHDDDGRLVAVAADAWSAPTVGFISGVATRAEARGRGYAARTCAFLIRQLLAEHGRVALWVDGWNHGAISLYRRLGLSWHPVRAAWVTDAVPAEP